MLLANSFLMRRLWLAVHRWIGLLLGLVFVFQGVTGALCLYRDEIDRFLIPAKVVAPEGKRLSLDQIMAVVHEAYPSRQGVWVLELPDRPDQTLTALFEKPHETEGRLYAPLMVSINPYTGAITHHEFWGDSLSTRLVDLHAQFNQELSGRRVAAFFGVFWCLSLVTGWLLWWPGFRVIMDILRCRWRLTEISKARQIHRTLGWISAPFLVMMALTGVYLAYPEPLEQWAGSTGMGHGADGPAINSTGVPTGRAISLAEAVLMAQGPFSSAKIRRVTMPLGDLGTYKIHLAQKSEVNQKHPITTVWIDRWSGQIRHVQNPGRLTRGQTMISWMWPLHTGEVAGEVYKSLWFILGLIPAVFFVTGVLGWLSRPKPGI